jgi:hypothetical protein
MFNVTFSVSSNVSGVSHQSFIASVNLRTWIFWSGSIKAVWDQAKASNQNDKNVTTSRTAEMYTISLGKIGGKNQYSLQSTFFVI